MATKRTFRVSIQMYSKLEPSARIFSVSAAIAFEDTEARAALKAAGYQWNRAAKAWTMDRLTQEQASAKARELADAGYLWSFSGPWANADDRLLQILGLSGPLNIRAHGLMNDAAESPRFVWQSVDGWERIGQLFPA